MTLFLNFRVNGIGGAVVDPYLLEGDGTASPPALSVVPWELVRARVTGKNILFATHGFNLDYERGADSLDLLGQYLGLAEPSLFIGMLWPGDSWLPVVDYPFEGSVAIDCGKRLAKFCNDWCASAQSLSFASHSLGARFVLEAVASLVNRKARAVCVAAAAINRDCLSTEYSTAAANSERISILASHEDEVLKVAFRIGDPIADLLHDDHSPFEAALGSDGPPPPAPARVRFPWQIPDPANYGHGDYLPPGKGDGKWRAVADFIKRAFFEQAQTWPPP